MLLAASQRGRGIQSLDWTGDCGRGTGVLGTDTLVEYIIADAMRCLPKCSDGQLTWKTRSVKKAGFVQKWMDLGTGAPGQVQFIIRTVQQCRYLGR